jgi:3',5'-cyclic AMP phosphodiesterase CpdA
MYLDALSLAAPVHVIPGNHDAQWWKSPLGLLGEQTKFTKYRTYFGDDLAPVLRLDGLVIAGILSAHGIAPKSVTFNPNDLAVKGHLSAREVARVRAIFDSVPPDATRIAVLHHNVLPGVISNRWGLARPNAAQRSLLTIGADVILCGHDHTEGAGQIEGKLVVSTAGTPSLRSRGGRASAFNVVRLNAREIAVQSYIYVRESATYRPGDTAIFARTRRGSV